MRHFSWKSLLCGLLAAAISVPAAADDLGDLKARLDAIEAENAKLREDLNAVKTSEDVLVGQMSKLSDSVDKKEDAKDPKKEDPLSFSSKWSNGWEASTKDKQFKYHVGGRVQFEPGILDASRIPQTFLPTESVKASMPGRAASPISHGTKMKANI